jgi:polyhydroxybutyrate depolymerase
MAAGALWTETRRMSDRLFLSRRELQIGASATVAVAAVYGGREAAAQSLPVPSPTPRPLPAFVRHSIPVSDGGATLQRSFLAHVPLAIGPMPAVIVFHGGGQDASAMVQHWEALIPDTTFAIVCPQALVDPLENKTRWQFARPGDVSVPTTDLAFVAALLAWLQTNGRIDMQRIYAAGFSSGAGMTWQLTQLNQFVQRFRGFAPVSHRLNSAQLQLSDVPARTTPKPVAFTMGTAEPNWSGYDNTGGSEPTPPDNVRYWLQRNRALPADAPQLYRCNVEQPVDVFGVEQLYRPDPAVASSAALLWMTSVNGGHCWPLTGHDPSGRGLVNRDVNWTKRVVAFWNTYAGMGLPSVPDWRLC